MALTAKQLADIRKKVQSGAWNKAQINAAVESIDDNFNSVKAAWSADIDTATAPFTFTNPQKKKIFAYWLLEKFNIEVV